MSSSAEPRRAGNVILIGKKPLMTYVTATLVQLASEPTVIVKAQRKKYRTGSRCGTNYCQTHGQYGIQDWIRENRFTNTSI